MRARPRRSTAAPPSFFWQGLLIPFPVFVLALVGLVFVRHDRRLIEAEAKERARQFAEQLVEQFERALNTTPAFSQVRFVVDSEGRLVQPPPFASVPTPVPLDASLLSPDQNRLLSSARQLEFAEQFSEAAEAYLAFTDSDPPAAYAAAAEYSVGLALARSDKISEAFDRWQLLLQKFPGESLESGLPVRSVIHLKQIELHASISDSSQSPFDPLAICSNAVNAPNALTPLILDRLSVWTHSSGPLSDAMRRHFLDWEDHQIARRLHRSSIRRIQSQLQNGLADFLPFWTSSDHGTWLITIHRQDRPHAPEPSNSDPQFEFKCLNEDRIKEIGSGIVARALSLPSYAGVDVELAGRTLLAGVRNGGAPEMKSSAVESPLLAISQPSASQVRVAVRLVDTAGLYRLQQTRSIWLSVIILAAAVAALAGWFAAWRAFHRQRRLQELKSNFISSVSHELRAPIASVRLMGEGLASGRIRDEMKQQTYFKFIVQECHRLSALIENVLDFSRIEQGRKPFHVEPTDIGALVRDTVQTMEPYATDRGVRLAALLLADTPDVDAPYVDGRAIQQALVNLIDNAIKHSPRGMTVTVGLEFISQSPTIAAGSPLLKLWVEDRGPGIPAAEHTRIFEQFYRRGSELRRETQGIGIGLSIVKYIAEAHHGRVTVTSAPGQATRFTIELPTRP